MTPGELQSLNDSLMELANEYGSITAEIERLTERLERCRDKMRACTAAFELMKDDEG